MAYSVFIYFRNCIHFHVLVMGTTDGEII